MGSQKRPKRPRYRDTFAYDRRVWPDDSLATWSLQELRIPSDGDADQSPRAAAAAMHIQCSVVSTGAQSFYPSSYHNHILFPSILGQSCECRNVASHCIVRITQRVSIPHRKFWEGACVALTAYSCNESDEIAQCSSWEHTDSTFSAGRVLMGCGGMRIWAGARGASDCGEYVGVRGCGEGSGAHCYQTRWHCSRRCSPRLLCLWGSSVRWLRYKFLYSLKFQLLEHLRDVAVV